MLDCVQWLLLSSLSIASFAMINDIWHNVCHGKTRPSNLAGHARMRTSFFVTGSQENVICNHESHRKNKLTLNVERQQFLQILRQPRLSFHYSVLGRETIR